MGEESEGRQMRLTEDDKSWIAELMSQKLEEWETRLTRAFKRVELPAGG